MKRYWQVLATLLAIGCTSAPTVPREVVEAERCLRHGPCIVMQATNAAGSDARVYLNGTRFAYLTANATKPELLFVPRWRLNSAGCLQIEVRLMAGDKQVSSVECPRGDVHLELSIDGGGFSPLHVWLNPMVNR
jgi:hypothetical protein